MGTLLAALTIAVNLGLFVAPAAHASDCHASKTCGKHNQPTPPDYCESGGITGGPALVDQVIDDHEYALQGIAHDPGVGGFGAVSSPIYTATRNTPAAGAGTEAACTLNAPDRPFSL